MVIRQGSDIYPSQQNGKDTFRLGFVTVTTKDRIIWRLQFTSWLYSLVIMYIHRNHLQNKDKSFTTIMSKRLNRFNSSMVENWKSLCVGFLSFPLHEHGVSLQQLARLNMDDNGGDIVAHPHALIIQCFDTRRTQRWCLWEGGRGRSHFFFLWLRFGTALCVDNSL